MPSNVRQLLDNGVPVYPITDKSLVIGLQDVPFESYVVAWDGASTPVPANIPAGVVVTYNTTDYPGTLAAGSATAPYLYLVASASQQGEYDRYIVTHTGSTYAWTQLGSTAPVSPVIADNLTTNDASKALSAKQGKILGEEVGELEAKLNNFSIAILADNPYQILGIATDFDFYAMELAFYINRDTGTYKRDVRFNVTYTSGGTPVEYRFTSRTKGVGKEVVDFTKDGNHLFVTLNWVDYNTGSLSTPLAVNEYAVIRKFQYTQEVTKDSPAIVSSGGVFKNLDALKATLCEQTGIPYSVSFAKVNLVNQTIIGSYPFHKDRTYHLVATVDNSSANPIQFNLFKKDGTSYGTIFFINSNTPSKEGDFVPNEDVIDGYIVCVSSRSGNVTFTITTELNLSSLKDGAITERLLANNSVSYEKLKHNPLWSEYNVVNWDNYFSEVWIDKSILPTDTAKIEARGNGGVGLYVIPRKSNNTATASGQVLVSGVKNGDVCPIVQVGSGYTLPIGTIIGYVVFKDIDGFINNPDNVQLTSYLNVPYVYEVKQFPAISAYVNAIIPINERLNDRLDAVLPDTIYAVVGTELNIWNDTVAFSIDAGLQSPRNYNVAWKVKAGQGIERCYRFTPTSADANKTYSGNFCYVYNALGELVGKKEFAIKVVDKDAISTAKVVTFFGDSYGASTMSRLYENFTSPDRFTGVAPTFVGTQGTTYKYNAQGGYTLSDYATQGRRAFRLQVTNAPTIILNGKYTNNGKTWTVVEINVTEGNGNILITKGDTTGTDAPQTNGTLVPAAGNPGVNVPYTDAELTGANPLWDNGALSLDTYKTRCGMQTTDVIDAVIIQLGTNNSDLGDNLENLDTYLTSLYDLFVTNGNVNCKFVLCLPAKYSNAFFGLPTSYTGATDTVYDMKRIYDIKKKYIEFAASHANTVLSIVSNAIDRFYGYPLSVHDISDRFEGVEEGGQTVIPKTEIYHTGYGHPNDSGYYQIADANFCALMCNL